MLKTKGVNFTTKLNMKKYTLTLIFFAAASACFAEDVPVYGYKDNTAGTRNNITGTTSTSDLILDSTYNSETDVGGPMYRAPENMTVHSLRAIDTNQASGKGAVNLASYASTTGLTVDVNAASGTVSAIDVLSWKQNYTTTTIKNSYAGSTAVATVNFGDSLTVNSSSSTQAQTLVFDSITANVTATSTSVGISAQAGSTIKINSGATVNWSGSSTFGASGSTRTSALTIDGAYNLASSGSINMNFYSGAVLTVGSTGTLNINNNTISLNSGTTSTINGNLTTGAGSRLILGGTMTLANYTKLYTLTLTGTLTQATAAAGAANIGLEIHRTATISSGASLTVDEKISLKGDVVTGVDHSVTTAKLIANAGSNIVINGNGTDKISRLILWGLTSVTLNKENAITDQNGDSVRLVTAATSDDSVYTNLLYVNANQTFSSMNISSNISIYLDDAHTFSLDADGETLSFSAGKTATIYNFRDNAFYVGTDASNAAYLSNFVAYDADSSLVTLSITDGWLTAVPEPAEWAAILGALALGFAAYRRRR